MCYVENLMRRPSRFFFPLLLIAVVGPGLLLRAVHLGADGPTVFPGGLYSDAPLKDEAAKGFAARSRCLFGAWSASPADDYRFWEVLSPVWTWSQYFWFKLTGPGYRGARLLSIAWSALAALFLYLALSRQSLSRSGQSNRRAAGVIAAAFMSFNFHCLIFGRLGLLETPLLALLIMAFYFQSRASEHPANWIMASGLWLMAWLVKQSAIIYLPVLILGFVLQSASGGARRRLVFWTGLISITLALAAAGAMFLDWDYRVRSVMNLRHSLDYLPDQSREWMQVTPSRTLDSIRYNLGRGLIQGYLAMFPISGPLAILELVFIAIAIVRTRKIELLPALAALWWLSARGALTLQGQAFPRFYIMQAPSTFLLAALALARLLPASPAVPGRRLRQVFVVAVMALSLLVNLLPWARWVRDDSREIERGGRWLVQVIGPEEATVVGEWAGPLCFDTPYRTFYLKNVFNRRGCQLVALWPTHLLLVESKESLRFHDDDVDPAVRRFMRWFPSEFKQRQKLDELTLFAGTRDEMTLILYRIDLPAAARDYCRDHPEGTSLKP